MLMADDMKIARSPGLVTDAEKRMFCFLYNLKTETKKMFIILNKS